MKLPNWSIWFSNALDFYNNGRLKESRKLLVEIQKSSPDHLPTLDLLSVIDFKLRNYKEAKKWTKWLLKGAKTDPDLLNRYAMILMKEGSIGEAGEVISLLEKFSKIHEILPPKFRGQNDGNNEEILFAG